MSLATLEEARGWVTQFEAAAPTYNSYLLLWYAAQLLPDLIVLDPEYDQVGQDLAEHRQHVLAVRAALLPYREVLVKEAKLDRRRKRKRCLNESGQAALAVMLA